MVYCSVSNKFLLTHRVTKEFGPHLKAHNHNMFYNIKQKNTQTSQSVVTRKCSI